MPDHPIPRRSPTAIRSGTVVVALAALAALVLLPGCGGPAAPSIITVNGRVIDFLAPVASANILVGGKATTTAADGTFSATGVHVPYDVTVSFPSNTDVWIYRGLTRTDPTLETLGISTGHQATVSGTIGTAPYQTGETGAVFAGGASLSYGGASVQSGTTTYGPGKITWGAADPLHTTLYAIRAIVDGSGNPTSYTGFGSLPVTLHDGDALTGLSIPTTSVTAAPVSGSVSAPTGYALTDGRAVVRFGPASGGTMLGLQLANASPSGTFSNTMVPVANGISYGLAAQAVDGAGDYVMRWSTVTAPNASATLTLPSAALPITPAPNAGNVAPGTAFGWTPLAGSLYLISIAPSGPTGPHVNIVTTASSTMLPDLSAIHRALPANAGYSFDVMALGPFASMDAAASPSGMLAPYIDFEAIFGGGSGSAPVAISGPDQPSWLTSSNPSPFTTAP